MGANSFGLIKTSLKLGSLVYLLLSSSASWAAPGGLVSLPVRAESANILKEPSFESTAAAWNFTPPTGNKFSLDASVSRSGGASLKMVSSTGGSFAVYQTVNLHPGIYAARAWLRADSLVQGQQNGLRFDLNFNGATAAIASFPEFGTLSGTFDWTQFQLGIIVINEDSPLGSFSISLKGASGGRHEVHNKGALRNENPFLFYSRFPSARTRAQPAFVWRCGEWSDSVGQRFFLLGDRNHAADVRLVDQL